MSNNVNVVNTGMNSTRMNVDAPESMAEKR
jgi:hypothetical protein